MEIMHHLAFLLFFTRLAAFLKRDSEESVYELLIYPALLAFVSRNCVVRIASRENAWDGNFACLVGGFLSFDCKQLYSAQPTTAWSTTATPLLLCWDAWAAIATSASCMILAS